MKTHPTANMLRGLLACAERPTDMRLNPNLSNADRAETIRIAIECIEGVESVATVTMPRKAAFGFVGGVQGLFTNDKDWSLFDLAGAKAFCDAIGFTPEKSALETE